MSGPFYIRTQRQGTFVGGNGEPELFDTRKEARTRADDLQRSMPSSYGKLIVSRWSERSKHNLIGVRHD